MSSSYRTPNFPVRPYHSAKMRSKSQVVVDDDEIVWWRAADTHRWRKAAFHCSLRRALIAEAARQGRYRTWTDRTGKKEKTRSRGDCGPRGDEDVTSYHPQQNVGRDPIISLNYVEQVIPSGLSSGHIGPGKHSRYVPIRITPSSIFHHADVR